MHLLIGTPAYGGMMHMDYVKALLAYRDAGISFELASIGNESLITRARNAIISYFHHHRDRFTHLLFLDADIRLSAAGLKTLLGFDVDVVGAAVPLKGYRPDGKPRYNVDGRGEAIAEHLYRIQQLGTGVMLLSGDAVLALVEHAADSGHTYVSQSGYDGTGTLAEMTMYDVFQVGVVDGVYLSEDYWVCRTLRQLGFDIHVSDAVSVTHHGMHGFEPLAANAGKEQ